jgi:hypothetical protein
MAPVHPGSGGLSQAEEIALAVSKPCGVFSSAALARVVALDLGDALARSQAGKVDVLEHDPSRPEFRDDSGVILDFESHLSEGA